MMQICPKKQQNIYSTAKYVANKVQYMYKNKNTLMLSWDVDLHSTYIHIKHKKFFE